MGCKLLSPPVDIPTPSLSLKERSDFIELWVFLGSVIKWFWGVHMDWFGRMALLLLDMLQKGDIVWSPATPPVHLEKDLKVSSCKPKASEREQSTQGTLQGTDEERSWGPAAVWATGCRCCGDWCPVWLWLWLWQT